MAVARWSLPRRLVSVRDAMAWLFRARTKLKMREGGAWRSGTWSPAVDLYETDDAFILKAELAGFSKADIGVEIKDRVLLLKGSRPREGEVNETQYHCMEWVTGAFQRCVLLPTRVDPENVSTSYKDGVFRLQLPKAGQITRGHCHNKVTSQSS
jgi:HSP20 family protein